MPSSGSFVTMYLAELLFGNGYMEIGLLISSLHGEIFENMSAIILSQNAQNFYSYFVVLA